MSADQGKCLACFKSCNQNTKKETITSYFANSLIKFNDYFLFDFGVIFLMTMTVSPYLSLLLLVGRSWAAASTEGLVVYSLDSDVVFDPFQLDCDVTPEKMQEASNNREHTKALLMSLRMNEPKLICQVMEAVKPCDSECSSLF